MSNNSQSMIRCEKLNKWYGGIHTLIDVSVDIKKAIGCAAACGIVIALFGSVGYVSAGWQLTSFSDGFAGFVYLPALVGIVVTSSLIAPIGAKATHYLPVATIKKVFALLLVIIALKMVFS